MSHQSPLSQWMETVSTMLPKLSRPQVKVLAYWSCGMVLAKSCGITLVCAALALQVESSEQNLLQRLREWCYSAEDKKGKQRRDLDVSTCFGPLLEWILAWWPADQPRLALALDATTLKKRFMVLVMSDRGLYAPWLYAKIRSLGWQPFMRINKQGNFRPKGEGKFRSLSTAAPEVDSAWCGVVDCFSGETCRLQCTRLSRWDKGYEEVWLIVTDLEPAQATAVWYGMRSWIEGGFKDTKRGGWGWHQTKMVAPERAERLWLAIAVATLWAVSVGGEVDANLPVSSWEALPQTHVARRTATKRSRPRMLSCFARGMLTIVGMLIRGDGLMVSRFVPEPWPTRPSVSKKKNAKAKAHVAQDAA